MSRKESTLRDAAQLSTRILSDFRSAVRKSISTKYASGRPVYVEKDGKIIEFRRPDDRGRVVASTGSGAAKKR